MAEQKLNTTISMTDKFSKTVSDFEKKLYHTLKPINSVEKSLKRLGNAFAFIDLSKNIGMLKDSSTELFFNIRNIGQSFGYIKDAFVGVVNLLDKVTAKGDELSKTAERLGFTVEELQKFEYVADLAGVSSENFTKGIKKLSEASVEAAGGQKEYVKAFKALGVSFKNADGSIKSSQELLLSLADRFAETGKRELSASQKIFAAQKLLGKSGVDLITVLNQGSDAIRGQMDELVKLGIIDTEQAQKSAAYRDEVGKLKRSIDGLSIALASDLFGPMTASVEYLTSFMISNRDVLKNSLQPFIDKIPKMTTTFTKALPGILEAFTAIASGVEWVVDKIGVKWPMIIAIFTGVGIPLIKVVASVIKVFVSLFSSMARIAIFAKGTFSGTISKLGKGFGFLGKATKMAVPGLKSFGFALKGAFGPLGWALLAIEEILPLIKKLTSAWGDLKFDSWDNAISSLKKIGGIFQEWLESLTLIGPIFKMIHGLSVNKVDFSAADSIPDLTAGMQDVVKSSKNMDNSELYRASTSVKTINNNTRSAIDVNFNNVPKNVNISRRGFNDPTMFGFSMSPAY